MSKRTTDREMLLYFIFVVHTTENEQKQKKIEDWEERKFTRTDKKLGKPKFENENSNEEEKCHREIANKRTRGDRRVELKKKPNENERKKITKTKMN